MSEELKRSTKVTVKAVLDINGERTPLSVVLPLDKVMALRHDEDVPEVGSVQWRNHAGWWNEPATWGVTIEDLVIEWENPAHDSFPGTVAMFPEHEPEPVVRWSA